MDRSEVDVVVVGGGQAGLAMSHVLGESDIPHMVLDGATRIGETWRNRWDSFTLVTPNWMLRLPGHEYSGDEPDGFMGRDRVVAHLEDYAASLEPPIRPGTRVEEITVGANSDYSVRTTRGDISARRVVVACGTFHRPRLPAAAAGVPRGVTTLHSSGYRSPDRLPDGGVLVVGSGQSGAQIARELYESGRDVYLSVGGAGRAPRRYRGRDTVRWMADAGVLSRTVDELESPAERFQANPHVSGRNGGETLNLHQFARDGVTLLGRLVGFDDVTARLAPDLHENLRSADQTARDVCAGIDVFIAGAGIEAPEETLPVPQDGFDQAQHERLDLEARGIRTVLWATGFSWDFGWVRPAALDEFGYPVQRRGVTDRPGLYFLGLHFMHTLTSGLFAGVGDDARHVAAHMAGE